MRVGRELLGRKKRENKGLGPLDRWVMAKGSGEEGLGKVEKEEAGGDRNIPGPGVREMRERFEKGGRRPQ